ncbi:MAG TPA: amino acid adenylation domain-containing protein [Chloroflexota bacterium]|nr:amino acid adenylation domain-containing protein [Chloroflexota bacterium]
MTPALGDLAHLSPDEQRELLARLLREKGSATKSIHRSSHTQRGMWVLHRLAPQSTAYNLGLSWRVRSPVDLRALERAFQALAARHAALRTTFALESGELVQVVHGYQAIPVARVDGGAWDEDELSAQVAAAARQPFDLEHGPLLRVTLFSRADADHVLLIVAHHIALDGQSMQVLVDELGLLYAAETAGERVTLPRPERQYPEYVDWQLAMLESPEGARLQEYWLRQLAGELPRLNLPADHPRPPVQRFRGGAQEFAIDAEVTCRLRTLAKANGTTLYAALLAALQVLLYRYTGQEDILVAGITAGRSRAEFERAIGCFINTVALRADLSGTPTFIQCLSRARETLLGALDHEDYPFSLLVQKLQADRDPSRLPLFDVAFQLQRIERYNKAYGADAPGQLDAVHNVGGLELEPFTIQVAESQFDLFVNAFETDTTIAGKFLYDPDLFEAETIARMVGHFQALLEGVVVDPDRPIGTLPLLSDAERQQLLVEWNATAAPYPRDVCLHDLVEQQVARTPDAVAVAFEGEGVSYRELDARANRLAHYLQRQGVGPDVLVGLCLERSVEMVVALLGVLKAGGAYLPLDPTYPHDRLAFMLDEAAPPVVLTQARLRDRVPASAARVLCLDADWTAIAAEPATAPGGAANPEHLAYVLYTSGSTGKPKGVMVPHQGVVNRLLWMQEQYQLTTADRVLQKTPYTFDVSGWEFFWPLLTGACLVMARPEGHKDPGYLVDLIQREQITTLHFVPPMLEAFLDEPGAPGCHSVRQVFCSGEALPYQLQERFFARLGHAALHNLYGPTEASIDVTYWPCQRRDGRRTVPIGFPVANTQIYILDRQLQPVPIGVPGELHIGGTQLARGYLNRPELTAEKFIPDPFGGPGARLYKTGDLARWLPNGAIEYLGRLDHQVKLRGFRIELGEIEAVLAEHPAVRDALVLAREDTPGDKRLVAYLIAADHSAPEPGKLRAFLKERLPDYMVPAAFVVVSAFPLTPNGKVDRQALPAPEATRGERAAPFVAPRSEVERQIAAIWQAVLRVETVGLDDNFFDLGGHSLLATQLVGRLQRLFGVELPVHSIFEAQTVAAQAQRIESIRWAVMSNRAAGALAHGERDEVEL